MESMLMLATERLLLFIVAYLTIGRNDVDTIAAHTNTNKRTNTSEQGSVPVIVPFAPAAAAKSAAAEATDALCLRDKSLASAPEIGQLS